MPSFEIDKELQDKIRQVPHFRDSQYVNLDIAATLDYFRRKFVDHLYLSPLRASDTLVDVGTGYGWLAMALAKFTPAKVVAVDMDMARLDAAKSIACLLGLEGRIEWRVGTLQCIPLLDQEADVTFCIEVLEHVQRDFLALKELDRVTRRFLVLTTPNGAFPVISHDTCLPFCHWLPMNLRNLYAFAFGRLSMQQGNRFWTPFDFPRYLPHFKRVSKFLHYRDVDEYFLLYPYYLPYGTGEWRRSPSAKLKAYFHLVSHVGSLSQYFLHSLAGTFERCSDFQLSRKSVTEAADSPG